MAVGTASGLPMAEEWNGAAWSIESVPAPGGAGASSLSKVSRISDASCTAVGAGNGTLAEYWDGSTWTIQITPNPENAYDAYLSDVSCNSDMSCVAVGPGFSETWDGSTWTFENTVEPAGGTGAGLGAVSCLPLVSPASCTGVGSYADSTGTDVTLAETWNGSTWTIESTPNPTRNHRSYLSSVSCLEASACIAIGIHETTEESGARALIESSDGTSWAIDPTPPVLPVSVSPSSGTPKESVVVSGFGFAPNSPVKAVYHTDLKSPFNVTLCITTAAADGSFSCIARIPPRKDAGPNGSHLVTSKGGQLSWSTTFTVT